MDTDQWLIINNDEGKTSEVSWVGDLRMGGNRNFTVHIHVHTCTPSTVSFEAIGVNYTFAVVGPLRAYMHTCINCNQYRNKLWICMYQGETNNID